MDILQEYKQHYRFFRDITGASMKVYNKFRPGLLESAYEAALKYLLELEGYKVARQVFLPIYWDHVQLEQNYRMDLVINDNVIVELKAINYVDNNHRSQLFSYMNITHLRYGMLINFGPNRLFSEWYERDPNTGKINKVRNI